jgi:hypothetical protein
MPKEKNMTEYRVPGLEGEDDQITFEADDLAAEAISFAWLIKLGHERTGGFEWVCVKTGPDGLEQFPEPETDEAVHHRWAWDVARMCFTNHEAIVHDLVLQPGRFHLCERCHSIEHGVAAAAGSAANDRDPNCEDCARGLFASMKALMFRLKLLDHAVAAWASARWPELEIRGFHRGATGHEELRDEVRKMAVTQHRAQSGRLH